MSNLQTILGSGGAIGVELAKTLPQYTDTIRLVSRNPQKVNPGDEIVAADLLDPIAVKKAVEGSSVVYVTIGFPYKLIFWQENWPRFMRSVIDACIEHKAKLVFFDNIYMYDPNQLNGMTEETAINPSSQKGKVRAQLVKMLTDEMQNGTIQALIARSVDFYGPSIRNTSMFTETILKPLNEGKKANWIGKANCRHSFTFTPDAGKATALLGNTESAYGQTWHLPTAGNPPTGRQWIELAAKELGVAPKFRTASKIMVKLIGLFVPIMREMYEMMYQYDRDYVFNSDKFEKAFDFRPTSYQEGIKEIIHCDFKN